MRIIDMEGVEVTEPDLEAGHLVEEEIYVDHPATEEVPEETKTVVLYQHPKDPSRKLVKKEVVRPHVPAKPAWREVVERVWRYVPYTEDELAEIAAQKAAAEEAAKEAAAEAARQAALKAQLEQLPGQVGDLEEAVAEVGGAIGESDASIAALKSDVADLMGAVAEIGTLVAGEE